MRYIGCKTLLLDNIKAVIDENAPNAQSLCDVFSGTATVARYFKKWYEVYYNDLLYFSYVLQRGTIENAKVYGNKKRGVIMPDGQKYHLDNALNDMNGRDWTFFINSVFSTRYPTRGKEGYAHEIRKIHPTPKPPQLMRDLFFYKTQRNSF